MAVRIREDECSPPAQGSRTGRLHASVGLVLVLAILLAACGRDAPGTPAPLPWPAVTPRVDPPEGWAWEAPQDAWAEDGIVFGGVRRIAPTRPGLEGGGQGALFHVSVTMCPPNATVAEMACKPENFRTRELLLRRYRSDRGDRPWPDAWMRTAEDGSRVAVLREEGGAPDLAGEQAPCRGVMTTRIHEGRLYRVRAYAWYTEYDEEGLLPDLEYVLDTYTPEVIDRIVVESR